MVEKWHFGLNSSNSSTKKLLLCWKFQKEAEITVLKNFFFYKELYKIPLYILNVSQDRARASSVLVIVSPNPV